MANQVIIEFVGDTSNLEAAYNKVAEQVTSADDLNLTTLPHASN